MKKLLFLVVVLSYFIFSCVKENKKQGDKIEIVKEITEIKKMKIKDSIYDLESFLKANHRPKNIVLNVDFGGKYNIEEFSLYKDSVNYYVFKTKLKDKNIIKKDYRIALRLWPYKKDKHLLSEDSKKRNIDYDNLYSIIKDKKVGDNDYIVLPIKTKINNYKRIEVLLYDMSIKGYLPGTFNLEYDINSYLSNVSDNESIEREFELGRVLSLKGIYTYKSQKGFYMALGVNKPTNLEELSNYKLVIRTYPFDDNLNLLGENAKKNNVKFDSWINEINILEVNNKSFIAPYIDTPLNNFKKVEFLMYDKSQKRYVGIPLVEENFSVD